MPPTVRKAVLVVHLTVAVGWIGAVVVYLVLGGAAASGADDQTVRSAWIAMELVGWYVIVPLAIATLVSGVVMALGTRWGLFRHYWVLFSLALTAIATVVLILHMPSVSAKAATARIVEGPELHALGGDLVHPGVGLVLLLFVQALNVYKPRGATPYGRRRAVDLSARSPSD